MKRTVPRWPFQVCAVVTILYGLLVLDVALVLVSCFVLWRLHAWNV
jgi:hypothetical protein